MFTGIVKAKGTIGSIRRQGGDVRMSVRSKDMPWSTFEIGESISVNGVCLTAVTLEEDGFETDVSLETLGITALGRLGVGDVVNLEPALALSDRLGGHLVSGHVDCLGKVTSLDSDARSLRLTVEIPEKYSRYVAKKGSICVDGVSLTINSVSSNRFDVNIIPHTAEVTIASGYKVGTDVNIEVDLLARYIERLLGKDDGISMDFLEANGYV